MNMKIIGLKRGIVKILPHQSSWHVNFKKEKNSILSLDNKYIKDIEHVGSTSVPNMPAKPIIDIVVGIDNFYNASKLVNGLSEIGYIFAHEPRRFQWLFIKQSGEYHTHYLKIVRYKGNYWNEYQDFKNILIRDKRAFEKYKKIKLKQGDINSDNREKYTASKKNIIKEILNK
jgi:GrpB-like predicted nucleotidyltransferase (UPF0157 family)